MQVGTKLKTFHANLLKRYIEWDQVDTHVSCHVSVAVLGPCENESDDDKEILRFTINLICLQMMIGYLIILAKKKISN